MGNMKITPSLDGWMIVSDEAGRTGKIPAEYTKKISLDVDCALETLRC